MRPNPSAWQSFWKGMWPRLGVLVLVLLVIETSPASACAIPVFRYALERWSADWYEVDVFHRGPLSAEDRTRLDALEDHSVKNGGAANIEVVRADLDGKVDQDLLELWQSLGDVELPLVVVRLPAAGQRKVVWQGSINELDVASLVDSPQRRELTKRQLAGHSIVWLVVHRGDAEATARIKQLLSERLTELESEIPLPQGVGLPGSQLASTIPLAVKFSMLEIHADDPAEAWLARILACQGNADSESAEPLVAPVFGRGRAAEVFPAVDLTREVIGDVSQFLCGACSCQVKQLNPGFDLLVSTAWEEALFDSGYTPPTENPPGEEPDATPQLVPIPAGPLAAPAAQSTNDSPSVNWLTWGVVGVALVAMALTIWRTVPR